MKLSEFVVRTAILPDMKVQSKEGAIRTMVESLAASGSVKEGEKVLIEGNLHLIKFFKALPGQPMQAAK